MKIITTIIDMILTLAIIAGILWIGMKCVNTFDEATEFKAMTKMDKGIMYVMDNERYNKLQDSYNIVASILGE